MTIKVVDPLIFLILEFQFSFYCLLTFYIQLVLILSLISGNNFEPHPVFGLQVGVAAELHGNQSLSTGLQPEVLDKLGDHCFHFRQGEPHSL